MDFYAQDFCTYIDAVGQFGNSGENRNAQREPPKFGKLTGKPSHTGICRSRILTWAFRWAVSRNHAL